VNTSWGTHANAVRAGAHRGWRESLIWLRNPGDVTYTAVGIVIAVVVVYLFRDVVFEGTSTSMAVYILASILAVQLVFSTAYGLATALATEREDGTLLRLKSMPHGMRAHSVGLITRVLVEFTATAVLTTALVAVVIWPRFELSLLEAIVMLCALALGLVALTAFGFVIGSVFRSPRAVGGWGLLVVGGLIWLSGLVQPLSSMAGWVQIVGQFSPLYWLGLALRGAVLPDEFAVIELGGEWRLGLAFAVLAAWAIVGLALAPVLLSRMARRETSSSVERQRQQALQRV
jgi:ABC-2 type transport system permease protein